MLLTFLVGLLCPFAILWLWRRKEHYGWFKRIGIPGPPPDILQGNLKEINTKGAEACYTEWINKYGKLVGHFLGKKPVLLIADEELLKKIQVKEYQNFLGKDMILDGFGIADKRVQHAISLLKGESWKQIRHITTPAFSTGKIRAMVPSICAEINIFLAILEPQKNINIMPIFKKLVFDVLSRTTLGAVTNAQKDINDPFMKSSGYLLTPGLSDPTGWMSVCFPSMLPLIVQYWRLRDYVYWLLSKSSTRMAYDICMDIISERSKEKGQRKDILQILLTSKYKDENEGKERVLTHEEIAGNIMDNILGGLETIASIMSYTCNFLVHNQQIQDKCRREISNSLPKNVQIHDYDSIQKLEYLEQVIQETMRIHPPVTLFINRTTENDYISGDVTIPKDTIVMIPVYFLHRDKETWPDPMTFNPERFSSKSELPFFYQPFGTGPRSCVGKRLAMIIMKATLAQLLLNYKLVPNDQSEQDVTISYAIFGSEPTKGVHLSLIKL